MKFEIARSELEAMDSVTKELLILLGSLVERKNGRFRVLNGADGHLCFHQDFQDSRSKSRFCVRFASLKKNHGSRQGIPTELERKTFTLGSTFPTPGSIHKQS